MSAQAFTGLHSDPKVPFLLEQFPSSYILFHTVQVYSAWFGVGAGLRQRRIVDLSN